MSDVRLEEIPGKIQKLKDKKSKAEGSIETIMDQLKSEFNCNSIEEAEKKLETLQVDIEKDEKELQSVMEELQGIADWDSI